jgi:excisionase family DNA binding protein
MRNGLITPNEIAGRLGVERQTIYLWVRQGRIPYYRLGRLIKFDENEVLAYFRAEADNKIAFNNQQTTRLTLTSKTTIDPTRALPADSTALSHKRERYKALLGMVK